MAPYKCDQCAAPLPGGSLFCPKCGRKFDQAVPGNIAPLPRKGPKPLTIGLGIFGVLVIMGMISNAASPTPPAPTGAVARQAPITKPKTVMAAAATPAKIIPAKVVPQPLPSPAPSPQNPAESEAYKLACVEAGSPVDPSDPVVEKIQIQVDALRELSTGANDSEIVNTGYVTHMALLKKGVDESTLSILEAVNQSIPEKVQLGKGLPDIFAAYSTLREQGMSREETIKQIHGMLQTIAHPK